MDFISEVEKKWIKKIERNEKESGDQLVLV